MASNKERILIVESDPEISHFIAHQTLQPLGYQIIVETEATSAMQLAVRAAPDVILANVDLPGLSGKDLLVALSSQGIHVPVIVIARRGMENKVIQAFRLGASDYLVWPVREAEVVAAVERALIQIRSLREREDLAEKLRSTNAELEQRVRELTALYNVGKAVVSITDQRALFDRIVQGAVAVTEADIGWFLQRDENTRSFILGAHHRLPKGLAANLNKPWDDGVSSMVTLSGEPLSIYGEPIRRFKISHLGKSALAVPVKVKKEVIGLLEVVRKAGQPFTSANQKLLEAVADYASISIVNARLFRFLEERAQTLQHSVDFSQTEARVRDEMLHLTGRDLLAPLHYAREHINHLIQNQKDQLNLEQIDRLGSVAQSLEQMKNLLDLLPGEKTPTTTYTTEFDLVEMIERSIARYQPVARSSKVNLKDKLPEKPLLVRSNAGQIAAVVEGLISNAIKFSLQDGQVTIGGEINRERMAHIWVQDHGLGISPTDQLQVFSGNYHPETLSASQFGGTGITLPLVKRVIEIHGGKIWLESALGEGSTFHFTLPMAG